MKKFLSILLCIILCMRVLAGCNMPKDEPPVPAPTPEAAEPVPAESSVPPTKETTPTEASEEAPVPTETEPPETAAPEDAPPADENTYRISLPGFISIFDEPSYDGRFVRPIGEQGVFTIVEEKTDGEGNVWGKLKSGAGWINLSELETNPPVMAGFGSEKMLKSPHHLAVVDDSEYMEYLVFDATQTLTDVRLTMLLPDETGYTQDSILHTLPELVPGTPLIAEVVFYGDFTTYGLSFKDAYGAERHFAVNISGRNGAPVLQEYQA